MNVPTRGSLIRQATGLLDSGSLCTESSRGYFSALRNNLLGLISRKSNDEVGPIVENTAIVDPLPTAAPPLIEDGVEYAWKWDARCHVWSYMEAKDIAICPRPVHCQIPNFIGSDVAAVALSQLDVFQKATSIVMSGEHAQAAVRKIALENGKTLFLPRLHFRNGFMTKVRLEDVSHMDLNRAVVPRRLHERGTMIEYEDTFKADVVVIGCVAVEAETGGYVGTGNGFADLEYSLLRMNGAIDANTLVITTVHDDQLQERVRFARFQEFDLPVDIIVTPTRIIYPETKKAKPDKILWQYVGLKKLRSLPLLKHLRAKTVGETKLGLPLASRDNLVTRAFYLGKKRRKEHAHPTNDRQS